MAALKAGIGGRQLPIINKLDPNDFNTSQRVFSNGPVETGAVLCHSGMRRAGLSPLKLSPFMHHLLPVFRVSSVLAIRAASARAPDYTNSWLHRRSET
jgi:hypothetical protein